MARLIGVMAGLALLLAAPAWSRAGQAVTIVAAENFYGDLARQLAGPDAAVTSILGNPDDDPHAFEATPSVARAIADARIVIANGADNDPWMEKLLGASRSASRTMINVAALIGRKPGDNPHLWYEPATMPAFAKALAAALTAADPAHRVAYQQRLEAVLASLKPIDAKVALLRQKHAGTPVTATEPVFGYMAAALGLVMRNERFQLAVMNDTEPSASDVAAFEDDLRQRRVKLLIYNSQATDESARRLLEIARRSKLAVIGVTETEPRGKTYQDWMQDQLDALDDALAKPDS